MFSEEHLYSIALRKCSLVGDIIFKKLVDNEGSAENVWKLPKNQLTSIFGIGSKISSEIGDENHLRFAEKELEFCTKNNIQIRLRHHQELPYLLSECEDAPAILYQKGSLPDASPLSVVGTRNITPYGRQFITDLISALPKNTLTVSGLALGADTEVHEKSLEHNIPTIGILAHGFHTLYPAKNRQLSERIIAEGGALLTEFTTAHKPDRENFIQRNRIVAGVSQSTIVVETAFGGGSISTATFANRYNRDVYALPGKITDKFSQGCNQLIYNNKAAIISTVVDLIKDLGFGERGKTATLFPEIKAEPVLLPQQKLIYNAIKKRPNINLDDLAETTDIPAFQLLPILLEMEISGHVRALSGRQFVIN